MTQQSLAFGATGPVPEHTDESMEWVFDFPPPSGRRTGGELAEFAFDTSVDVLVREVVQNALDQRNGDAPVEVDFNLVEYTGPKLEALLKAMDWPELKTHLSAAAAASERFARGVKWVESGRVLGLWIEDRGTSGLRGPETGDGNFATLCRDRLFSHKDGNSAGGSYGLGKAVLWRFSQWSTVAFVSNPSDIDIKDGPRAIAKTSLPFHTVSTEEYDGDGWLGVARPVRAGRRAESLWGKPARSWAAGLGGTRGRAMGTSVLICGFEDPTGELAESDPAEIAARIRSAAEAHFWPAMQRGSLVVRARANTDVLTASESATGPRTLLGKYDSFDPKLLCRTVDVPVPAARDGSHPATVVPVDVVIEQLDQSAAAPTLREVIGFRSTGMVVLRDKVSTLGFDSSFRAIVLAGAARRGATAEDNILEQFLREAEPPAHDRWIATPRLKDRYMPGYASALVRLKEGIHAAIRDALAPAARDGDAGPESLRRLFRIGNSGGGGGRTESDFHFPTLDAQRTHDEWRFDAVVRPGKPIQGPWCVSLKVRAIEAGGNGAVVLVSELVADIGEVDLNSGRAQIRVPAGTDELRLTGVCPLSELPAAADATAIQITLEGGPDEQA